MPVSTLDMRRCLVGHDVVVILLYFILAVFGFLLSVQSLLSLKETAELCTLEEHCTDVYICSQ